MEAAESRACGSVGIADYNAFDAVHRQIVGRKQFEFVVKRYLFGFYVVHMRPYFIKRIGHVGIRYGVVFVKKCGKTHTENFVASVAHEYVFGGDAVSCGDRGDEFFVLGVGIQSQPARVEFLKSLFDFGRRRVRTFVGVELHVTFVLRLFARGIRKYRLATS